MGGGIEASKLTASRNNLFGNPLAAMESNECRLWAAGAFKVHCRTVSSDYDCASWHKRSVRTAQHAIGPKGWIVAVRQAHRLLNELGSGHLTKTGARRGCLTISATGKSQTSDDSNAKQT